jgi:hypothetical protein
MTLWRDPMDELIAELERELKVPVLDGLPSYEDFCAATDVIMFSSEEDLAEARQDPRVKRYFEQLDRHWRKAEAIHAAEATTAPSRRTG